MIAIQAYIPAFRTLFGLYVEHRFLFRKELKGLSNFTLNHDDLYLK